MTLGIKISELQIMKSSAGWYLGHSYIDTETNEEGPWDRVSYYFKNKTDVNKAFDYWIKENESI